MIWATLALLGIPIWFIAVLLIAVFRNRKSVRSSPDVFEFFYRSDKGWKRRPGYALWVSDVLIVHLGPGLVRTEARQITDVTVDEAVESPPKKLQEPASQLTFVFEDAAPLEVAVAHNVLEMAQGPFVPGQPTRRPPPGPRVRP